MTMLIRVIDFETTGIPTEQDRHAICEVGWCDIQVDGAGVAIGETFNVITQPGRSIPPEARAVHHISDDDVKMHGQPLDKTFMRLVDGPPNAFCAHNADYEREFYTGGDRPWVCTYKVALRIWPDAPSHSLQVLRYWLGFPCDPDRAMPPHRAGPDAYIGAALLGHIIATGRTSIDEMIRWSSGPALLPRVMFGKHKGSRWEDVPADYLRWIVEKSDLDRDVKANAKHHLKARAAP